MIIQLVDEHDTFIKEAAIDTLDLNQVIYRAAMVWIVNDEHEVLLAQRAVTKLHSPGLWGPSAAGILEAGETYESNIIKETKEEIDITIEQHELIIGPKVLIHNTNPDRHYFIQNFSVVKNYNLSTLSLQEDEVAAVKRVPLPELIADAELHQENYADVLPEVIKQLPFSN